MQTYMGTHVDMKKAKGMDCHVKYVVQHGTQTMDNMEYSHRTWNIDDGQHGIQPQDNMEYRRWTTWNTATGHGIQTMDNMEYRHKTTWNTDDGQHGMQTMDTGTQAMDRVIAHRNKDNLLNHTVTSLLHAAGQGGRRPLACWYHRRTYYTALRHWCS